jgi:undecaprenyl diphosphate synthase
MSLKEKIDATKLPKHIAIIMDGNGRWAKGKGKLRIFGHHNGVSTVKTITESCAKLGIKHLTLYAFSTENWSRPAIEVRALMELLVDTMRKELPTLMQICRRNAKSNCMQLWKQQLQIPEWTWF